MRPPPEKALLLKGCLRCLLFANACCVPLRLFLFGFGAARAAEGLLPLLCLFLYLPLRCRALRLDIRNFFDYLEEE